MEEQVQFRKEVLREADSFVEIEIEGASDKVVGIYEGYSKDILAGYVLDVVTNGYGGAMSLTVGVDIEGKVTSIIIGDNNETPGLGLKVTEPEFLGQFNEATVHDTLTIVSNKKAANEIQGISGATKSANAVVDGVQAALDTVNMLTGGN